MRFGIWFVKLDHSGIREKMWFSQGTNPEGPVFYFVENVRANRFRCVLQSCLSGSFSAKELKEDGFTAAELREAPNGIVPMVKMHLHFIGDALWNLVCQTGFAMESVKKCGFPREQILKARCFTLWRMSEPIVSDVSCNHVCQAGFSAKELKEDGFTAAELREAPNGIVPMVKMHLHFIGDALWNLVCQTGFTVESVKKMWFSQRTNPEGPVFYFVENVRANRFRCVLQSCLSGRFQRERIEGGRLLPQQNSVRPQMALYRW